LTRPWERVRAGDQRRDKHWRDHAGYWRNRHRHASLLMPPGPRLADGAVRIAIVGRGTMAGRTLTVISLPGLNFGPVATGGAAGSAEGAADDTEGALSSDTANAGVGAALTVAALGACDW